MKISVVTVCYNAADTIAATLRSVAAQQHDDFEHIVIDGASRDATAEVVQRNAHPRLRWVSEPDKGIYDAMNKGIRLATGDLIGFLNADDFYARTDALSLISGAGAVRGSASAVGGAVALLGPNDLARARRHYRAVSFAPWMLRFGHMPPHPGFYATREAFDAVGEFDPSIRTGADFEWMVRFFHVHGLPMRAIPETLVGFRLGGTSSSGLKSLMAINREAISSCRRWGLRTSWAAMGAKYLFKVSQFAGRPADFPAAPPLGWAPDQVAA